MNLANGSYDTQELLGYIKQAERVTKKITNLIRERWTNRDKEFGLLDEELKIRSKTKQKEMSHHDYIKNLNEQMEENRRENPTKDDDKETDK